jgi:hypothetical protein
LSISIIKWLVVNNLFMNQYVYNYKNNGSANGICESLSLLYKTPYPVIVCVGSDLVVGDSLGPYVGTKLIKLGAPSKANVTYG